MHAQKRNRPCAKEKFDLTSDLPLIWNGVSFPWLLAGSAHVRLSLILDVRPCLLAAAYIKNTIGHDHNESGLISHQRRLVYLTPCLGDVTLSIGFRKNFSPTEWLLNPEIKLKFKWYLRLFSSFLQEFLCSLLQTQKKPMN